MTKTITEMEEILNTKSITQLTEDFIEFTYDLGGSEDAERFSNKVKDYIENYKIEAYISILDDDTKDENGDEPEWYIGVLNVENKNNLNLETLKDFISDVEAI